MENRRKLIGELVKELREKKEFSLRQLAYLSDVSVAEISRIENGERKTPSTTTLEKLARPLGVPIDTLLEAIGIVRLKPAFETKKQVKIPIMGTVKAGYGGIAYEEYLGDELTDAEDIHGGSEYMWLKVKGDSMINEGIFAGDLALIRIQPEAENGSLVVATVDDEEGTIKRFLKDNGTVVLQPANPLYQAQIFSGKEQKRIRIVGQVKQIKRKF